MARRLTREEVVTISVLKDKGQPNTQIAQVLGVSEGAVRHHLRRQGQTDGRRDKPTKTDGVAQAIAAWVRHQQPRDPASSGTRPVNVRALLDWLVLEHGYTGSYKSVLRHVRKQYPKPKLRPFRRVETPAGAQAQVDWWECSRVDLGDGPQTLYAFVLVLSHSRKEVVIWCRRMDQFSWHHAHNEALRRLEGVPAVLRIDNLKTGVARGAGPWGVLNEAYRAYARAVGFHVDPCLPRCPEDKGKVESRIGKLQQRLDPRRQTFASLADLQRWSDGELEHNGRQRICPATGKSVEASWRDEQAWLRPLPILPEIFDVAVTRTVQKDCTVHFEGRQYSVPFLLCSLIVEVHGGVGVVQVLHEGQVVAEHRRGTAERLLLDAAHYEGEGDSRVSAPVPLGKLGRRLQEIAQQPVEQRPMDTCMPRWRRWRDECHPPVLEGIECRPGLNLQAQRRGGGRSQEHASPGDRRDARQATAAGPGVRGGGTGRRTGRGGQAQSSRPQYRRSALDV
ncbi:MAG TPA: IS21 family transposase [Isosphaeraceae bacterium]|nr:IS21 family transposase [Isosphaeraceae bacterium]